MQVVAIDLNDALKSDKNEIAPFLAQKAIQKGDRLEIFKDESIKGAVLVAFLVLILVVLYHLAKAKNLDQDGISDSDEDLEPGHSFGSLGDFQTPEEVEEAIEKNLGIEVELIDTVEKMEDPFAETFGIWKNHKIDINTFRDDAWRKTK